MGSFAYIICIIIFSDAGAPDSDDGHQASSEQGMIVPYKNKVA